MALSINLSAYDANGGAPRPFIPGNTYFNGDIVVFGGTKYKAKTRVSTPPPDSTRWVEIVEKTIGNATRDYTSIAAWLSATPNLITNNQIWKGLIYKEGSGATEWPAGFAINNSDVFTSSDCFIWLEPASGQSFIDNASVRSNPLVYDNTKGVALNNMGTVFGGDRVGYLFARGLQLRGPIVISNINTFLNIAQSIVEWPTATSPMSNEWGNLRGVNTAFRAATTSGLFYHSNIGGHFTNCTFLGGGGGTALSGSSANQYVITNCAFFNFSNTMNSASNVITASSTYNASNTQSFGWPSANSVTNLITPSQIINESSPFDMRARPGCALMVGRRISAETNDVDITGYPRSKTTPTIGAWESSTINAVRPASDITANWQASRPGTEHYALLNEATFNDANYIYATATSLTDEIKFQVMTAPISGTPLYINYRVQGTSGNAKVTVSLYCGATLIKSDTLRSIDSNGYYVMTVTSAEWATVTDWADMRLRFVSS